MRCILSISTLICVLGLLPAAVYAAPVEENDAAGKSEATVVSLRIRGSYPEGPQLKGLFEKAQPSLASVIKRIGQAADDKDVAALWLRIEGLSIGRGKLNELRSAIAAFRESGKPAYAELTQADSSQYLLAIACNEIFMPPSGALIVPGVRMEVTFYKGLLDKLGIKCDVLKMGKYKGAGERLARTGMSEPLRESCEALVDDIYERLVATIAKDRGMEGDKVKTLLDQGMFTVASAKRGGLIDHVLYADEFKKTLCEKLDVDKLNVVTNYRQKKTDLNFSGFTGLVKLVELIMGGKPPEPTGKKKKIAVIYTVGTIVSGKNMSNVFGASTMDSASVIKALRKAAEDDTVAAIVLRIDSPGGSSLTSDLIWHETQLIEKPIIASMGDVAASGGYYIAMGADKIFAEPDTLTGSIGVIGGRIITGGLYDKIGVSTEVICRGKNMETFTNEPFTPEEREAWMVMVREVYRQFVSHAAEGRKMSYEKLDSLAQGRIYTGQMAKNLGLVDELGTLNDAIAAAKKAAGLETDEEIELLILPRPKTIFERAFGNQSLSGNLKSLAPEVSELLHKAKLLRQLFSEPTLMWMPYEVKLR